MGLGDNDIEAIETLVAYAPEEGILLEGTGGCTQTPHSSSQSQ